MKHIIFIKTIKDENDVEKLTEALNETRAVFSISISNSCVTVEGSNDILHHAKQVIQSLGFIIE